MLKVKFIQTSDSLFYKRMLDATSQVVLAYCEQHQFDYESYVGIKRGILPWHATYNRIPLLKEIEASGYDGWLFYLDADAYIQDLDFDLREYLADKGHYAGIFAGHHSEGVSYTINAGGFALNLAHPVARQLILDYAKSLDDIGRRELDNSLIWGEDVPEDQLMLYRLLQNFVEQWGLEKSFLFEFPNHSHVNNGPFIRQVLRSHIGDFNDRCRHIEEAVDAILSGRKRLLESSPPGYYIPATHERVGTVTGVKGEAGISAGSEPGVLCYGPYIHLPAGRYVARAIGRMHALPARGELRIIAEIVHELGSRVAAAVESVLDVKGYGELATIDFTLDKATSNLEVRLTLVDFAKLDLYAIHIVQIE